MEEISQELALRMAAFVRNIADGGWRSGTFSFASDVEKAASAIVAMLPEPIDPDLVEAREIADNKRLARDSYPFAQGQTDSHPLVQTALAGIRRGRELAKARAGEGSV